LVKSLSAPQLRATFPGELPSKCTFPRRLPVKRLSLIFFVAALLLAGVAIAAVVVRAGGLLPGQATVSAGPFVGGLKRLS
jgi:hypothetical protein